MADNIKGIKNRIGARTNDKKFIHDIQPKTLYISAPSRSGSSLLVKALNYINSIAVINEPINSVDIMDKNNILSIFHQIKENLRYEYMIQRVNAKGLEVTDTFPLSKMKWGIIRRDPRNIKIIGIKKSFPAFSNKDFFKPFIQEWPFFVKWMIKKQGGKIIVIVRDPKLAILSWKTTFEALKATTEIQCNAWNLITRTILSTRSDILIIRYEDLILNPIRIINDIGSYLGIKIKFRRPLFKIKRVSFNNYFKNKSKQVPDIKIEIKKIKKFCGETAKNFGYSDG